MRISDWSSDVCSSDLWKVETLSGPIVVKRPLPQLRVAAEWLAPVERGTSEVRWLRRARGVDPAIAPEVLAELPGHAFAMRFLRSEARRVGHEQVRPFRSRGWPIP